MNLQPDKDATGDFSEAVVEKVPEDLREAAQGLVQGVIVDFGVAIDIGIVCC